MDNIRFFLLVIVALSLICGIILVIFFPYYHSYIGMFLWLGFIGMFFYLVQDYNEHYIVNSTALTSNFNALLRSYTNDVYFTRLLIVYASKHPDFQMIPGMSFDKVYLEDEPDIATGKNGEDIDVSVRKKYIPQEDHYPYIWTTNKQDTAWIWTNKKDVGKYKRALTVYEYQIMTNANFQSLLMGNLYPSVSLRSIVNSHIMNQKPRTINTLEAIVNPLLEKETIVLLTLDSFKVSDDKYRMLEITLDKTAFKKLYTGVIARLKETDDVHKFYNNLYADMVMTTTTGKDDDSDE